MPKVAFDRYLLVVASDKPVARGAIAAALEQLDVRHPREVSERVAALAARNQVPRTGVRARSGTSADRPPSFHARVTAGVCALALCHSPPILTLRRTATAHWHQA